MKKLILFTLLSYYSFSLHSQKLPVYYQSNIIPVENSSGKILLNPFGGGLKFPLFGQMDINFDWKPDLVVLDRVDNRLLTFVNTGGFDTISFSYQPRYENFFPDMGRTLIIRDYNQDGKADIFTFSLTNNAGITVYKNTSTSNSLIFTKIIDPLEALYFGSSSMLYVNSSDLPALEDVDGDGDLDILNFFVLGTFVDYFENLSVEKYGIPDSLVFEYADQCWGKFRENDTSNKVLLQQSCSPVRLDGNRNNRVITRALRHTGSALLIIDLDNDNDKDLLLSDVAYPGVLKLENGKSDFKFPVDSMIGQEPGFPPAHPINIRNMPGLYLADINNDGVKDLIAAPLDDQFIDTFQSLNQVWAYLNKGSQKMPDFNFATNNFLQNEMIDLGGATSPAFFDYDADGDEDLFVVTSGDFNSTFYKKDRIILFENTGNSHSPVYQVSDSNYLNFDKWNLSGVSICFFDLDQDGDKDLLTGNSKGELGYFENTAGAGNAAVFTLKGLKMWSIDPGEYSTPTAWDVNKDGKPDLIVGEQNGNLNYYKNTGTLSSPVFQLVSDTFGGVYFPVSQRESLSPVVFDLDQNGEVDLLVGTASGKLMWYPDFTLHVNEKLPEQEVVFEDPFLHQKIKKVPGKFLKPAVAFLDGDNQPDILLGCNRGGLLLYGSVFDSVHLAVPSTNKVQLPQLSIYPNPASATIAIKMSSSVPFQLAIYDMAGKKILEKNNLKYLEKIDVSFLHEGLYIVKVWHKDRQPEVVQKLMIIK